MPARPLTDDIARLAYVLTRMHQGPQGRAALLMPTVAGPGNFPQHDLGRVAKACGATPDQVQMWVSGEATPTTGQALAWLTFLYEHADKMLHGPPSLNGEVPPAFVPEGASK